MPIRGYPLCGASIAGPATPGCGDCIARATGTRPYRFFRGGTRSPTPPAMLRIALGRALDLPFRHEGQHNNRDNDADVEQRRQNGGA